MARECAAQLAVLGYVPHDITRLQQFLFTPGISVVSDTVFATGRRRARHARSDRRRDCHRAVGTRRSLW